MKANDLFVDIDLPDPFSEEELYYYFEKVELGDKLARKAIIEHNIKLVIYVVLSKFSNTPYDLNELVSIGTIGLIKAVDTFDINKGFKFSTYAARCIYNKIVNFMRMGQKYINDVSLDATVKTDEDDENLKLENILPDENFDLVLNYEKKELYKIIRELVEELPEREKYIIMRYYQFIEDKPVTLQKIADELGISRVWAVRINKKIVEEMRIKLERLGAIEHVEKRKRK